jgi:SM-20-related protein
MKVPFHQFNPKKFSFRKDPVLVLDNFWTEKEMEIFREAMRHSTWTGLQDMPAVSRAFPDSGNWLKAEIGPRERQLFLDKMSLPCIMEYVESFPNIRQRHVNFNFYSYGAGDCLPTHDDTDEAYAANRDRPPPLRRLALATYVHSEWNTDWGGELIIYHARKDSRGNRVLEVVQCITPQPGSLALFAVPRFHRVCRVDALAGEHKRLSIAGWFMTEHFTL